MQSGPDRAKRGHMIPRVIAVLMAFLFAFATPSVSLRAQQDEPLTAAQKQELARGKFKELTERMQSLMVQLQKSEPDDSKLLSAGLTYAQEKKMQQRLDKAGSMLKQERWDEALVVMNGLKEDLTRLLNLLQNRDDELRKLVPNQHEAIDAGEVRRGLLPLRRARPEAALRQRQRLHLRRVLPGPRAGG